MEFRFTGKKAIVTGAGKGIGRGLAVKLSQLGGEVIAISRTQADLDSLKKEHTCIKTICLDVSQWEATKQAIESIGPVDILVNNAGIFEMTEYGQITESVFDGLMNTNVKSVINITQIVANEMKERGKGGAIVNISSMLSMFAAPGTGVYCATKGALDQTTRSMAVAYGPHQIRVNSINPGIVRTALTEKQGIFNPKNKEVAHLRNKTPLGRFCEVEDVVWPVLFLLSDKASMINGIILPIDGGLHTLV